MKTTFILEGDADMGRTGNYKTKQRETILAYITENWNIHVTVNDIVTHLIDNGTPVGVTTVYRCLDKLVEQGIIRKYIVDESRSACYQLLEERGDCNKHYHLKCLNCGILIHLDCDYLQEIDVHISSRHNFRMDNSKTVFYGHCENCISTVGRLRKSQ